MGEGPARNEIDGELVSRPFKTPERAQRALQHLRDELDPGLTWPEIAALDAFEGVPMGSLHYIYKTGKVSKLWRELLGVKPSYPPRIAVSKVDMDKALASLVNNIEHHRIMELAKLLEEHLGNVGVLQELPGKNTVDHRKEQPGVPGMRQGLED